MGLCGSAPPPPDYAAASRDAVLADLNTAPFTQAIDRAAAVGTKITLDGKTYDFTGLGDSDYNLSMANKLADAMLEIRRKYGDAYLQTKLEELSLADPEGVGIRKELFGRILEQIDSPRDLSLANQTQQGVLDELNKGGRLDPGERRERENFSRGRQVESGITRGNAAVADETSGLADASAAAKTRRQQAALQFLQSGASPEDLQYRETQQNMANVSNFLQGRTPTAEFQNLSGAQQGAVPFVAPFQGSQVVNPNAGPQGAANAQQLYGIQNNLYQNQANPYLAGLSLGINSFTAGQALRQQPTPPSQQSWWQNSTPHNWTTP